MSVKTNATVSMHDQRGGHGQTKQHQQASVEGVLFGRDPFNPALEGEGVNKEGMNEEGELGVGQAETEAGADGEAATGRPTRVPSSKPQPFATSTFRHLNRTSYRSPRITPLSPTIHHPPCQRA